jgi:drug/metabolite transporter (DMT)-like permease
MRIKADLVLLLVAMVWGSAFAAQRIAGIWGSVFFFNGARFLIAAVLLLPLVAWKLPTKSQFSWICAAGTILFLASALQQAGLKSTTAANAGFLTSLYVIIVPFVMFLGWGVKLRRHSLVAVLFASCGAFLLSSGAVLRLHTGDALEIIGAGLWAVHVVLLGKFASRYDVISFSVGQMLVSGLLNLAAGVILEVPPIPVPPVLLGSILYTALISLAIGYTLQLWGQRHTPPTDAAIILSMESVFAAIAGTILLGETLDPVRISGCILIISAVLLSQRSLWSRMERARPTQAP